MKLISMERIRVKVRIDITKPVPIGVFIPVSENVLKWVSCTSRRVFQLCERCAHIGHYKHGCTKQPFQILDEINKQRAFMMQKMQVDYAITPIAPYFACPVCNPKNDETSYRKTIKINVWYHRAGPRYAEDDFVRDALPNVIQADFSSSNSDKSDHEEDLTVGQDNLAGVNMQLDDNNNLHMPPDAQDGTGPVTTQALLGCKLIGSYKKLSLIQV